VLGDHGVHARQRGDRSPRRRSLIEGALVTGRFRTAVCCASLLLATLFCGLRSGDSRPARDLPRLVDPAFHAGPSVVLPAGFAATIDRATSDQFVRVVADDVDRAGDIDVVASLDSLDLAVWKNDGAGAFSPVSLHPVTRRSDAAGRPSVDGDPLTSNEWIQNGQPRGQHSNLCASVPSAPPKGPSLRSFVPSPALRARARVPAALPPWPESVFYFDVVSAFRRTAGSPATARTLPTAVARLQARVEGDIPCFALAGSRRRCASRRRPPPDERRPRRRRR
jgi:hypothetical protein